MFSLKKKYYLIIESIKDINLKNIKKRNKFVVIYRNHKNLEKRENILKFRKLCKLKAIGFYVANNIKLAISLNSDGLYLSAFNKTYRSLFYKKYNFRVIGSAHNIREIKTKEIQKVNKIFISSIFKKNKNYLGLNKFKNISKCTNKNIIALGGITKKNIKKLNLIQSGSFAGISFFE